MINNPPALYDSDDFIDFDLEFVGFIKVLQSAHVCGQSLQNKQIQLCVKPKLKKELESITFPLLVLNMSTRWG